jgi:hypothetical protein
VFIVFLKLIYKRDNRYILFIPFEIKNKKEKTHNKKGEKNGKIIPLVHE